MRILFLGDIVGEPGRAILTRVLPTLREHWRLDLVVANAENASGGSGITVACFKQLRAAGVDACTMGDHVYKRREIRALFKEKQPICRPANYPAEALGPELLVVQTPAGDSAAVFCLQGRLFMRPVDCFLAAADRILAKIDPAIRVILVDMHAEATSEKQVVAWYLDGRVSATVGTHTHVPTADARILPKGTAAITDLGMTGPYEGVIGRKVSAVVKNTQTLEPLPFEVAVGDPRISGALLDIDEGTGLARSIDLVHLKGNAWVDGSEPTSATPAATATGMPLATNS